MSTTVEQVTEPCTFHGEGPFWDAANDRLLLVDMLAADRGAIARTLAPLPSGGAQKGRLAHTVLRPFELS